MNRIPDDLVMVRHRAVSRANPGSSWRHPSDEARLVASFDACAERGFEVTPQFIDVNWPQKGIAGSGGDPAKSDMVWDGAYRVLDEWKSNRRYTLAKEDENGRT